MSSGAFWRCVPCGSDVQFGTRHDCPKPQALFPSMDAAREAVGLPKQTVGPRTPWPAVDFPAHLSPKE